MTGKELIDFIRMNHAEDAIVEVQYRDDVGCYSGTDDEIVPSIIEGNAIPKCLFTPAKEYKRIIL